MPCSYRDLGMVANAEEPRTSCLVRVGTDDCLVICSKGFVLIVNLNQQTSAQIPFPENYIAYPFGSLTASTGKVYLGAGTMFLELDPARGEFTYYAWIHPESPGENAWCFAEAPDGSIYFGAHPITWLTRFCPATGELTDCGILDSTQSYVGTMAVDAFGYVYCVIGTETYKIVVWNPVTGKAHELCRPCADQKGAAVSQGRDGTVYVSFAQCTLTCEEITDWKEWYQAEKGELGEPLSDHCACNAYRGSGFYVVHEPEENAPEIISIELEDHQLTYRHPVTGNTVTLPLEYQTAGADMSPLTLGPDQKIYGTTNHPIQLYCYDPVEDCLINYGKSPFSRSLPKDAWGNICAYAAQGSILGGCAYCGGYIIRLDTKHKISREDNINPVLEATHSEIYRPRCALACSDGRTILFGGFPPNGETGGGMVRYDVISHHTEAIPNVQLLRHHSILCMGEISSGEILCGTTVEAPCGGYVYEPEAALFLFDCKSKTVLYRVTPVPGATAVSLLCADCSGIIHAITAESVYFAFDPLKREVLRTQDLSEYGSVVRDGLQNGGDGYIYGLLEHAIYRIIPEDRFVEIVSVPDCTITTGMAVIDHTIYFGSNTHLCSCLLQ